MPASDSKLRAMQVVLEIARQSEGDEIEGKTRLFKAFYFAHLYYASKHGSYLTDWPIVRMPNGPGIDRFDTLLDGLTEQGAMEVRPTEVGPFSSTVFRATGHGQIDGELPPEAVEAVRDAIHFVADKSGSQLSDITHEFSASWNSTEDGCELNIYADIMKDSDAVNENAKRVADEIATAWK